MNDTALSIDRDIACLGCGYNVRGLADDATCPECGVSIAESIAMMMHVLGDAASCRMLRKSLLNLIVSLCFTCTVWASLFVLDLLDDYLWWCWVVIIPLGNLFWYSATRGIGPRQSEPSSEDSLRSSPQTRRGRIARTLAAINLAMMLAITAMGFSMSVHSWETILFFLYIVCAEIGLACRAIGVWIWVEQFKIITTALFQPGLRKFFLGIRVLAIVGLAGLMLGLLGITGVYALFYVILVAFPITVIATILGIIGLVLLHQRLGLIQMTR